MHVTGRQISSHCFKFARSDGCRVVLLLFLPCRWVVLPLTTHNSCPTLDPVARQAWPPPEWWAPDPPLWEACTVHRDNVCPNILVTLRGSRDLHHDTSRGWSALTTLRLVKGGVLLFCLSHSDVSCNLMDTVLREIVKCFAHTKIMLVYSSRFHNKPYCKCLFLLWWCFAQDPASHSHPSMILLFISTSSVLFGNFSVICWCSKAIMIVRLLKSPIYLERNKQHDVYCHVSLCHLTVSSCRDSQGSSMALGWEQQVLTPARPCSTTAPAHSALHLRLPTQATECRFSSPAWASILQDQETQANITRWNGLLTVTAEDILKDSDSSHISLQAAYASL